MLLVGLALTMVVAPSPAADAQTTTEPVTVTVLSSQRWTPSSITVEAGDSISVDAEGIVRFGPPPITRITPDGLPPSRCAGLIEREGKARPFTAPELDCWSLIGKIGGEAPFQVGATTDFIATSDGVLLLGVNDNRLTDNRGSWTARVTVTPAGAVGATESESSSSMGILLAILAALIVVGLVFFLIARRKRSGDEPTDEPAAVIIPEEAAPAAVFAPPLVKDREEEQVLQPVEQPVGSVAKAAAPLGTSVAPLEGEVVDVNIFEVELNNGTELQVGYNYFPEGTELHWQVRQGNIFAHGEFATNGGGNMYHYVTLPLGVTLVPGPAAADVVFTWAIGGVPFRYTVRRDPGL